VPESQFTARERAGTASLNWLNQIGRPNQAPDTLELPTSLYPPTACLLASRLNNKDVTSVVGVVVGADDTLVGDPVLLQSGGYGIFGAQAIAIARDHTFDNPTDADQPYFVQVTFTYDRDSCSTPAP